VNRRTFLAALGGLAATTAAGIALGRRGGAAEVLRVGVMANLTHAPLLASIGSGRLARALAPVALEVRIFRAGPRVTEALLGGAIDVGTSGPAPIVIQHARHAGGGGGLRVLGGVASGGASLVVAKSARVAGPSDLRGKRLAVSQIGSTQDVALRAYLRGRGFSDAASGGDVHVYATAPSAILAQMKSGDIDGAWLAEPWATRLVREIDAVRLVDERDLWPDRRFATALSVTRRGREGLPSIARFVEVLREEVARANEDPASTRAEAYAELRRRVGDPGARSVFDEAWGFVDFTSDPLRATVETFARDAASMGLVPAGSTASPFA
jgi:NitT/TauT family transport system substrate-binding protein